MLQQHNSKHPRYCLYCNKFYVDNLKYMEHMNKNYGLPVWNADLENNLSSGILPSEQAFGGVLKTYDIPVGEQEINLLSFMRSKQDKIENAVQLNTQNSNFLPATNVEKHRKDDEHYGTQTRCSLL